MGEKGPIENKRKLEESGEGKDSNATIIQF